MNSFLPFINPEGMPVAPDIHDLIERFGERLSPERYAVSAALGHMVKAEIHPARNHAETWGQVPSNVRFAAGIEPKPKTSMPTDGLPLSSTDYIAIPVVERPVEVNHAVLNVGDAQERVAALFEPTVDQALLPKQDYANQDYDFPEAA